MHSIILMIFSFNKTALDYSLFYRILNKEGFLKEYWKIPLAKSRKYQRSKYCLPADQINFQY